MSRRLPIFTYAQIPAPHLVIQQVPRQPGQMSRLIDRVGQPFGRRVWYFLGAVHVTGP
jgi:hypothetical protein